MIFNMKLFNAQYLEKSCSFIPSFQKGDYMVWLDLQDANLHVPSIESTATTSKVIPTYHEVFSPRGMVFE